VVISPGFGRQSVRGPCVPPHLL